MLKMCNPDRRDIRSGTADGRKATAEAEWERRWRNDPQAYNPLNTAEGRNRIQKTWHLISQYWVESPACVDLGAGFGVLIKRCAEKRASTTAVDIAEGALKQIRDNPDILCEKQWVPYTTLSDNRYQLVIATDLIAYIPEKEYRLFFSELTRLVTHDGRVVVSTPLDIYTENALERFLLLAETELNILAVVKSYHALSIRLLRFLNRIKIFHPVRRWIENSDRIHHILETLTKFFYDEEGISHVIIIGKRRPIMDHLPDNLIPIERKAKKTVWE